MKAHLPANQKRVFWYDVVHSVVVTVTVVTESLYRAELTDNEQ